jgi:hypothetical protein
MSPSAFGDPDFKDLDMRQQLARALYNCIWGAHPYAETALPAPVDSNPHDAPWLRAADECIRQMEWSAREAFDSCCHRGPLPQTLTLAPEDWKP